MQEILVQRVRGGEGEAGKMLRFEKLTCDLMYV